MLLKKAIREQLPRCFSKSISMGEKSESFTVEPDEQALCGMGYWPSSRYSPFSETRKLPGFRWRRTVFATTFDWLLEWIGPKWYRNTSCSVSCPVRSFHLSFWLKLTYESREMLGYHLLWQQGAWSSTVPQAGFSKKWIGWFLNESSVENCSKQIILKLILNSRRINPTWLNGGDLSNLETSLLLRRHFRFGVLFPLYETCDYRLAADYRGEFPSSLLISFLIFLLF